MARTRTIADLEVMLRANTANLEKSLDDVKRKIEGVGHSARAGMEESREAIALLGEQIGVRLNREVERFLAKLPGVSEAVETAFSTIAVIALIRILYESGERLVEWVHKNQEAAEKLKQSQEQFGLAVQKTYNDYGDRLLQAGIRTDELRNDHLDALHKQLELIDRQGFNQLEAAFKALESAADKTFANIKGSWMSVVTQFSFAQASGFKGSLERFGGEYSSLLAQGKGDEAQTLLNETQQREEQNRADLIAVRALGIRSRNHAGLHSQATEAIIERLRQHGITDYSDATYNAATQVTSALEAQQNIVSYQGKLTAADRQNAITAGNKSAAQYRVQELEKQYQRIKLLHGDSVTAEYNYWRQYTSAFKEGSDEWQKVAEHVAAARAKLIESYTGVGKFSGVRKSAAQDSGLGAATPTPASYIVSKDGTLALAAQADDLLTEATTKAAQAQAQLNAEWQAAQDRLGLITGAVTPYEAAMHAAAAHTADYRMQLDALRKQLADMQSGDLMAAALGGDPARAAKEKTLQTQIDQLTTKAKIQEMMDAQAVLTTTWQGMVDSVFDTIIKRAQDTQQQVQHIALSMIDGINSNLASGMTGGKTNFAAVFHSGAEALAKTSLEKLEGSLLGKAKKRGESPDAPLYVMQVGSGATMPGVFASHLPSVIGPGGVSAASVSHGLLGLLNRSNWAGSLFGGRLFGSGGVFDHFASGGDFPAGVPIDVGELGPERVTFPLPGHVTPTRDLQHRAPVYNIDARGTDPALTAARVQQAMAVTHSRAVSDARRSIADHQRRTPH